MLLNKTDLVDAAALAAHRAPECAASAARAAVVHTPQRRRAARTVLGLGAFDLERALALDSAFLEPHARSNGPGIYGCRPGRHVAAYRRPSSTSTSTTTSTRTSTATMQVHEHDHGQALAQVDLVMLPAVGAGAAGSRRCSRPRRRCSRASRWRPRLEPCSARSGVTGCSSRRTRSSSSRSPQAGCWALFTEHAPVEFGLQLHAAAPLRQREFGSHHHDPPSAPSGSPIRARSMPAKVNDWLSYLLQSRGAGHPAHEGRAQSQGREPALRVPRRAHGVRWPARTPLGRRRARRSRLVFIGRNLDRHELEAGFESCVA